MGGEHTGPNPTDRGKLGTKRSIITDRAGIPLSLALGGANRHDIALLEETLFNFPLSIPMKNNHFCGDKGYDSEDVRNYLCKIGMKPHIKNRGQEIEEKKKGKSAKRWTVERTMSWINQYRRLKIRWEKKSRNYEALLHFSFAIMAFKEAGVLG